MVVTINAANHGQAGGVTETLSAGFNYVSNSLALVVIIGAVYIVRRRMSYRAESGGTGIVLDRGLERGPRSFFVDNTGNRVDGTRSLRFEVLPWRGLPRSRSPGPRGAGMIRTAPGPAIADAPAGLLNGPGYIFGYSQAHCRIQRKVWADTGGWSGRRAAKADLCAANGTDTRGLGR